MGKIKIWSKNFGVKTSERERTKKTEKEGSKETDETRLGEWRVKDRRERKGYRVRIRGVYPFGEVLSSEKHTELPTKVRIRVIVGVTIHAVFTV
eukprot:1361320-Amorphochlora_amoeboformis.AAC.1